MESTKCGRRAPDRGALTGEAGNASHRQVMVEATARSPEWASAWRTPDESGPNISRVMRTNFGGTTAKIFREYSDSLFNMIKSFSSKVAQDIYHGLNSRYSRTLPKALHSKAYRLLDQLNAITLVETLQIPPSNHLEKLQGKLKGFWSIRINKQWRIIFKWVKGNAEEVDIIDYH